MTIETTAKALKVTAVIDAGPLVGLVVPNGTAKAKIRVKIAGRAYIAELNAKSLRKAVAVIEAEGVDGVAVLVTGKLEGTAIVEASIAANAKVKPVEQAGAA